MMIVWIILGAIGGLIALVFIIAAFSKKDFAVERTITVNKPLPETYDFLTSLQKQDLWSKWTQLDPDMKKTYIGTDKTVGFISKWESQHKKVGEGEQEIKKLIPNQRIENEIRFLKPMQSSANVYFTVNAVNESQTKVAWGFNSKTPFPFNVFMLLVNMENLVGKDFEEGLGNMKKNIEA
ncbi:SRPBCC family protein [Fluviicola taffensis]|uniref:Polyketide cyclase/dehydrase n=1 Tax=Fluviicola taffensis (strain DSM 16823 / NCIMB 13979 / RW262) TaxID=755732 RepID=F2IEN4_FLUTR|nr:SRPBCC family protein [Fluviicola taffensis]AEA44573.1 Polyketide cyclase/dehydrase [Fluviicola taffensis DSM 16823]